MFNNNPDFKQKIREYSLIIKKYIHAEYYLKVT